MGFSEDLDAAGFTNVRSELGKKVASGQLLVFPGAELNSDEDYVVWPWQLQLKARSVAPTPAMFEQFVGLWQKSPTEILRFAKKWGSLGVDEHGLLIGGYGAFMKSVEGNTYQEPLKA